MENMVLAVVCLSMVSTMTTTTFLGAVAQYSPQDFLDGHNKARNEVGVGPMVWNDTLAGYAQNYAYLRARDCELLHSGGPYGEDIFWGGAGVEWTAADAVGLWVSEKRYYDYKSNMCAPGRTCGHYTQVVWRDSDELGCGRVKCDTGDVFIVCSYYPPGNLRGQRPY